MPEEPGKGPTSLIVVGVADGKEEAAAKSLAADLWVTPEVSRKIVKSAPIVFIEGLTKLEVRTLTPKLQKLSEAGIEFRLTQKEPNRLPRIEWPIRPSFAPGAAASDGGVFRWDDNAFVCPNCGETYLFRRLGEAPLVRETGAPSPAPAEKKGSDAALRVALRGGSSLGARLRARGATRSAKGSSAILKKVEGEELKGAEKAPEAESKSVQEEAPGAKVPTEGESDEIEGLSDLMAEGEGDLLDLESALGDEGGDAPAEDLAGDLSDELAGGELLSSVDSMKNEEPGKDKAPAPERTEEDAAAEDPARYNVFVSSIRDKDNREEVAKMIAEIRSMSMDEAKKLTNRAMIKAADSVPRLAAEKLVLNLKKLKVSARMTKVVES